MARQVPPVVIELKSGATPNRVRQYPHGQRSTGRHMLSYHQTTLRRERNWERITIAPYKTLEKSIREYKTYTPLYQILIICLAHCHLNEPGMQC